MSEGTFVRCDMCAAVDTSNELYDGIPLRWARIEVKSERPYTDPHSRIVCSPWCALEFWGVVLGFTRPAGGAS